MALYRCGGGTGAKVATGSMSWSTSSSTSVNLGFKPKYLTTVYFESNTAVLNIYDEDYSATKFAFASASSTVISNFNTSQNGRLYSINTNGFTINKTSASGRTFYYFAIG